MNDLVKTLTVVMTDSEIRRQAERPHVRALRDARHPSLHFRYSTVDRAKGSWHVVVGKVWGKAGNYPDINAKAMLATLPAILVRRAADPSAKSTATNWSTVGELLSWYLERMARDRALSEKRKASAKSALKRHLQPRLGQLPLTGLNRPAIDRLLLMPMQERYALSFVRSVWGVLGVAVRQAYRLDLLAVNPLAGLEFTDFVRTKIKAKAARLHSDDVPGLLDLLVEQFDDSPAACVLAGLMLCHGTRLGETRLARWKNINTDTGKWFIPAADTKTKAAHTLPLTAQAKALIERYRLVQREKGYTGQFLFPGASGQALSATKASTLFTHLSHGEWSSHDLRKVARTAWTDLGVDYMVGELLLNHAMKDLDQAYIHTSAEQLKRQALETWHTYLDQRGFEALHSGTLARHEGGAIPVETMNNEASSVNRYPLPRRRFLVQGDSQATPHHQPGDGNE
ncbi:tyrosine-type recombinase/integrase [Pseudomonas haemolytica]|uniref:tyrosine-type recombinase/integrase n=1 Tax=Pseudomonas haemolytica TaxID=2600065 RepID=UPI0018E7F27E|nr:site-specific integrase [Pseudomonas haemolytica]MBJ2244284.1 tyrosine-type recombinase/integrase [Pseudomonas haemolytica]